MISRTMRWTKIQNVSDFNPEENSETKGLVKKSENNYIEIL